MTENSCFLFEYRTDIPLSHFHLHNPKTVNVRNNVSLRRVRVIIVAVEKTVSIKYIIFVENYEFNGTVGKIWRT